MKVTETSLKGVFLIEPQVFGDARGWFMESWSRRKFEEAGIEVSFVQDNQSFSAQRGTLRGLHYQLNPMAQAKPMPRLSVVKRARKAARSVSFMRRACSHTGMSGWRSANRVATCSR